MVVFLFLLLIVTSAAIWSEGKQEEKSGEMVSPWEGQTVDVLYLAAAGVKDFGTLVPDFEKKYGVKVNFELAPPKAYAQKGALELSSGKGTYDVVWNTWGTYHQWVDAGWYAPLDQFMEDPDIVDEDQLALDGFAPPLIDGLKVNGKQWTLPVMSGVMIFHYRTDVFDEFGIGTPPNTWEEFRDVAAKIHTDDVAGVGMRTSKERGGVGFYFPQILKAFGGSITKNYPDDLTPNLLAPESIEAVEYFKDITTNYGYPGIENAHYADQTINFQQGNVAMLVEGHVITGQLKNPEESTVSDKIGFAVNPKGSAGRVSANAIHGIGVPANADNKELGYKWIEWALSPEIQLRNAVENQTSSVTRPGLMLESSFKEIFDWGDGTWADVVSETFAEYASPYYRPMNPEWPQVDEIFSTAMSKIVTGQQDVRPALEQANNEIRKVYEEAGYLE
jgi:ABC-type glycerol-3-phosphate transport system substrate-binding protein